MNEQSHLRHSLRSCTLVHNPWPQACDDLHLNHVCREYVNVVSSDVVLTQTEHEFVEARNRSWALETHRRARSMIRSRQYVIANTNREIGRHFIVLCAQFTSRAQPNKIALIVTHSRSQDLA